VKQHHEVERAYALGPDDVLPDFAALGAVASVTEPRTATLVATYLDTDDLALVRAGLTLRRRTGGDDEGWHLKIPAGEGRDELHLPLGAADVVPATLAHTVLGWTRGRELGPVATIETTRTTTGLLAEDGAVLAEVADDTVVGTVTDGPATAWRELEVELVEAGPDLLAAADDLLAAASDIHPRTEQRKIGTVLAERLAAFPAAPEPDRDGPAGPVLHARLRDQVAELHRRDCDVRRGVDDGVHQLRVACRRLRGALATYRPLLEREVTDPVRDDLQWLARGLGGARDAEVARARLHGLVDELPADLVVGPVRRRLDEHYAARLGTEGADAGETLASVRYLQLLERLDTLVAAPPWTAVAGDPADDLVDHVAQDRKRLQARVRAVRKSDPAGSEEAWHDVRKAAKRLRYAAEVLEPTRGRKAKRVRKAAQEVTRVLGDQQDSTVVRADLLVLAEEATAAGESAFTFGVLHARETARDVDRVVDVDRALQAVRRLGRLR
jgi:CHAD domain-containing protein